jgi:hypothetical protein
VRPSKKPAYRAPSLARTSHYRQTSLYWVSSLPDCSAGSISAICASISSDRSADGGKPGSLRSAARSLRRAGAVIVPSDQGFYEFPKLDSRLTSGTVPIISISACLQARRRVHRAFGTPSNLAQQARDRAARSALILLCIEERREPCAWG